MESLDSFEYEISMYYNLSSSLIFDATSFIQLLLYDNYKEKETLNNRFKAISNDGSGAKHFQYKKNIRNWEKFNFLFLWSTLESFILKKNPVVPADFVINRFTVSIMLFYSDSMSAIARFCGCMERFPRTIYNDNDIHPFNYSWIETYLFLFILEICELLLLTFSKIQKILLQTYFLTSKSQRSQHTLDLIISLLFSWTQVRSVFNGTKTIVLRRS